MTENNEKTESPVSAVKAAVEAVASDAAAEAKSKTENLRADTRALGDKTRRYAQELWADVRALARGSYDLALETFAELRGKLTFKRTKSAEAGAEESNPETASSNAA